MSSVVLFVRSVNQEVGSQHVHNTCSTCLDPVISCVTHIEECLIIVSIRSRSRCNPLRGFKMAFGMALLSQLAQVCAFSTEHMYTVFPLVCKKTAYIYRMFLNMQSSSRSSSLHTNNKEVSINISRRMFNNLWVMAYFILEDEGVKQGVIPHKSVYWHIIDNKL
jgi:hypothetical protein